jgi:hypothetical protein
MIEFVTCSENSLVAGSSFGLQTQLRNPPLIAATVSDHYKTTQHQMKEFALIFRMDITTKESQPSPEQMKLYMTQWMKWINEISSNGQLANGGNHFLPNGKVIRPKNTITDGPYSANKESVAGYILVLAKDIKDAVSIAEKCPILQGEGTSVEIRETATPQNIKSVERTTLK